MAAAWTPASAAGDGETRFIDVSDEAGIVYANGPTERLALRQAIIDDLPTPTDIYISEVAPNSPRKSQGEPGVALFDYDGDGDIDIYATNGPNRANSLFSNQLKETGVLGFIDVAVQAGVAATAQESSGVCAADIDNDGDNDLYVLGLSEPNILYENNGDGTFANITASAGVASGDFHSTTCSFGDVNNDGLIDLVVANTYNGWHHRLVGGVGPTFTDLEHNDLFVNQGGNVFIEDSSNSGIENVSNMSGPGLTGAAQSWAIAMVDYDQDGDIDIVTADNQGGTARSEDERRGWLRFFQNDGTGRFTDITQSLGTDIDGSWMGLTFGDYNCDGYLDLFATNTGDYAGPFRHSTLFSGSADGPFTDAGPPEPNVFGWGTTTLDYDNDGDLDIAYHGGFDQTNLIFLDNPGVVYTNQGDCSGEMFYDPDALEDIHTFRLIHGMASGDVNDDGFPDLVTASSIDVVPNDFVLPFTLVTGELDSPFDDLAVAVNVLPSSIMPGFIVEGDPDLQLPDGSLIVEVNSADNGNNWIKVSTRGSVGTLRQGTVNRNGIGASVRVTPRGGKTSIRPIVAGSSYSSQNALEVGFGLGDASDAAVEVLWPGGAVNRAAVRAGEAFRFPEIPCDYATRFDRFGRYVSCVVRNVGGLARARVIGHSDALRLVRGALSCDDDIDRICVGSRRDARAAERALRKIDGIW